MRRLLALREREGLTLAELARRTRVPAGTLAWWSSRLRDERHHDARPAFVEVAAEPQVSEAGAALEVVLGNGRRVMVRRGFDEGELRRLVELLESC